MPSGPRSPVRTLTTVSTGTDQTLPSPIRPVCAALTTTPIRSSASSSSQRTSTRTFGTKSTWYSAPRYTSVCPRCLPYLLASVIVRPWTPNACNAALTSSSLNGLMTAVMSFIWCPFGVLYRQSDADVSPDLSACVGRVKHPGSVLQACFRPGTPGCQPRMASTKASGSNGARSSGPSPRPTSLTGTPNSRCTAKTIPPLAVPSSLVSTMPVTSTTSANTRAWRSPFCPVTASITSSTSSTGAFFSTTRLTLPSSSISPTLVCSRPAVSMMTAPTPVSMPSLTASNATLAGSAPSRSARTVLAPTRSPQVCSWSAAAARNVSAAPSSTVSPSPIRARASLPQVVGSPVPFTPPMGTPAGRPPCLAVCSVRSSSPRW